MTPEWEQDARRWEASRPRIICESCGEIPARWLVTDRGIIPSGIDVRVCGICYRNDYDTDEMRPYHTARRLSEQDLMDAAAYAAEQRRLRR